MWVSAISMTVVTFATGAVKILASIGTINLPGAAIVLMMALLFLCDVALATEAVLRRRRNAAQVPPSSRNLDWVAWIAAFALTAYYLWISASAVGPYRLYGGLGTLLPATGLAAVMLLFDVALVVHSFKGPRTQ
jgi:hypothetical protein